ncbi:MAG TPA: hypothetical protein VK165_17430 [Azonexus sp.]|nr:hypothetical protein [Azonexus sp.]
MSILQDLDPQYAKIHAQPSAARKPAILAGTALLVLGGGYWAMTQFQPFSPDQTATNLSSPASPTSDETQKNTASTATSLVKQETSYPMTRVPSAGLSATIRDNGEHTSRAVTQMPASTAANSSESGAASLADTEYRRPAQATTSHAKAAPAHGITKPERKSATPPGVAKSEKYQPSSGKRTNERDIDIINAIVR